MSLTRKSLYAKEERQRDYWTKLGGPFYVRGFQTLYPALSRQLAASSLTEEYRFLDLTAVFDGLSAQPSVITQNRPYIIT